MARAAHRRQRTARASVLAAALLAALTVPTVALVVPAAPVAAVPAAPVDAVPAAAVASPDVTESPGDPSEPPPTEPPPTEPPPTDPPPTDPPVDPTEPPVDPTEPPVEPTEPPVDSTDPPAEPTDPPAEPTDPPAGGTRPPAGGGPAGPPTLPSDRPPGQQGPVKPGQPRLGVFVTTSDVSLPLSYWNRSATVAELRVRIENTGRVTERVRLRYKLPAGVTDAGTRGCGPAGGRSYVCEPWTAEAGRAWSTRVKVRVDADAWKQMPLNGSVHVTATAPRHPDAGSVQDNQGFAVLFPPGPPVAGMTLSAREVTFNASGNPAWLRVRLGNTGKTDATGRIEIVLPDGVRVFSPPAGCRAAGGARTACDVARVRAGRSVEVGLLIAATAGAQRQAPLAGAVVGTLTPRTGSAKRMQMSFRITAAVALSTPAAQDPQAAESADPAALGSTVSAGGNGVRRLAISLIAVSVLLVVLALALAMTSLRRRLAEDPTMTPLTSPLSAPAD